MHAIEAAIPTAEATRYLQQLCKHWSHKLDVSFTPQEGRVLFNEQSVCLLKAAPDVLHVRVEAREASDAARLGDVVFQHLARFSFRDPLPAPQWRAAG